MSSDESGSQSTVFDAIGADYDRAFASKTHRINAVTRLIDVLPRGARVLDAGCGSGWPAAQLLSRAGCDVVGIDVSSVMLDLARQNAPEATFLLRDMTDYDARGFDAIVALFSLMNLPRADIAATLQRWATTSIKPGGYLLLGMTEGDCDHVEFVFLGQPCRISAFPRDQLKSILVTAGLDVVHSHCVHDEPQGDAAPEIKLLFLCKAPDRG